MHRLEVARGGGVGRPQVARGGTRESCGRVHDEEATLDGLHDDVAGLVVGVDRPGTAEDGGVAVGRGTEVSNLFHDRVSTSARWPEEAEACAVVGLVRDTVMDVLVVVAM